MSRFTTTSREVRAGCRNCSGDRPTWQGKNAQGVAAKHHDATGHETWVDVTMRIRYGGRDTQAERRLL